MLEKKKKKLLLPRHPQNAVTNTNSIYIFYPRHPQKALTKLCRKKRRPNRQQILGRKDIHKKQNIFIYIDVENTFDEIWSSYLENLFEIGIIFRNPINKKTSRKKFVKAKREFWGYNFNKRASRLNYQSSKLSLKSL